MIIVTGATGALNGATVDHLLDSLPASEIVVVARDPAKAARFADLASAGVNRISLGLQSFDDANLAFLGRAHSADEGQRALAAAQGAVDRVSFDLIYALPGDDEAGWSRDLDRAIALGTEHLSLYQLTIEPGTRFASMVARHEFDPLDAEHGPRHLDLLEPAAPQRLTLGEDTGRGLAQLAVGRGDEHDTVTGRRGLGHGSGGRRRLVIPPHLGYGDRGAGGAIKPGETLIFVVDLLEVR